MKIYTRTGDDGTTSLLGSGRVHKDALRIEAYGAIDEVNACLGVVLAHLPETGDAARPWLDAVQSDCFILGTLLATPPSEKRRLAFPAERTVALETAIDTMEEELTPLTHFVLPQGAPAATFTHQARAVTRRAERLAVALARQERVDREVIAHLNRLSDFLFVLARWINARTGSPETLWMATDAGAKTQRAASPARDRLDLNLKRLEEAKEGRKTLFEKAAGDLAKKKDLAQKLFEKRVDEMKRESGPIDKPMREIDLD